MNQSGDETQMLKERGEHSVREPSFGASAFLCCRLQFEAFGGNRGEGRAAFLILNLLLKITIKKPVTPKLSSELGQRAA